MIDTKEVVVNSEESGVSDIRKDEEISSTPSEYENDDRRNLASQHRVLKGWTFLLKIKILTWRAQIIMLNNINR